MIPIKNIKEEDIKKNSKKYLNNRGVDCRNDQYVYQQGFEDGAKYMKREAQKELGLLRRRIQDLKDLIGVKNKELFKLNGLIKKLTNKI